MWHIMEVRVDGEDYYCVYHLDLDTGIREEVAYFKNFNYADSFVSLMRTYEVLLEES